MNKLPLISIIIATYNAEKTLENALRSVKNQSFQNWECIIVDGASQDNTIQIVEKYADMDSRFHWISEPDKGIYDAFNKGWKISKGEWIYYLGADDELLPDGLLNLICNLDLLKYDVVYGKVKRIFLDGSSTESNAVGHQSLPYKMLACHQAIITRRSLIESLGGFDTDFKIIADKEFYVRTHLKGNTRYVMNNVFVAKFAVGGASSIDMGRIKEEYQLGKKHQLGLYFILFQITRVFWFTIKERLRIK